MDRSISIEVNAVVLPGLVGIPDGARGLVLFAHGSGSSRFSPRNNYVAQALEQVASLAAKWFMRHLTPPEGTS